MWSFILLVVINTSLWALPEARLLNQSTSGQTAVFNLGIHDGIAEGDFAVIVKQVRDLDSPDLRLVPAAKAKNIKINPGSSVWILYHIYDQELLLKGDKFLILSESGMLRGRRDPRLGRIKVVDDKEKYLQAAKNTLTDDKDRLAKLKDKYQKFSDVHGKEARSNTDFDLIDLEKWEKQGSVRSRSALVKSPNNEDFARNLRLVTFEKLVTGYLKKINDPDFNYGTFYDEQMKDSFSNEFRRRSIVDDEYQSFIHKQSLKNTADAKMYRAMMEKGETWSDNFSDEELHEVLHNVSALQEKDRRSLLVSKPNAYVVSLDYGLYLSDAQTDKDTSYRRDSRYALDFNFEATPFIRHPTLEKFTFDGGFRINKTAFESDASNVAVDEYSLAIGANWYPVFVPYAIESPVFFMGAYVRSGFATVTAPTAREVGKYTVASLPGLRTGFKYNFRNHVGLRIVASMETLKLEQYQASNTNTILPERTNIVEGKIGFGVGYSF